MEKSRPSSLLRASKEIRSKIMVHPSSLNPATAKAGATPPSLQKGARLKRSLGLTKKGALFLIWSLLRHEGVMRGDLFPSWRLFNMVLLIEFFFWRVTSIITFYCFRGKKWRNEECWVHFRRFIQILVIYMSYVYNFPCWYMLCYIFFWMIYSYFEHCLIRISYFL